MYIETLIHQYLKRGQEIAVIWMRLPRINTSGGDRGRTVSAPQLCVPKYLQPSTVALRDIVKGMVGWVDD